MGKVYSEEMAEVKPEARPAGWQCSQTGKVLSKQRKIMLKIFSTSTALPHGPVKNLGVF